MFPNNRIYFCKPWRVRWKVCNVTVRVKPDLAISFEDPWFNVQHRFQFPCNNCSVAVRRRGAYERIEEPWVFLQGYLNHIYGFPYDWFRYGKKSPRRRSFNSKHADPLLHAFRYS